jgi:hypothetical protein
MNKGSPFQVRYFLLANTHPLDFYMRVRDKKECSMQVKKNHASGSETCVYSWYAGPHGSKQCVP